MRSCPSCVESALLTATTRALFSRALAELKYLGMIKHSRKKADHLAKLLWNGL